MSGLIRYAEITQIGTFVALSSAYEDYLAIDPSRCAGGSDAPLRTTVEDAPGEDGALIFQPFDGAQVITLAGDLVATSNGPSSEPGYFDAVSNLYDSLKAALDAMKVASDSVVHPGGTLSCWKNGELDAAWQNFWVCSVTFSLVVDVFV